MIFVLTTMMMTESMHVCRVIRGKLSIYVTVYGKTRHMGLFVKIEFDVSLISSTLELTHLQV